MINERRQITTTNIMIKSMEEPYHGQSYMRKGLRVSKAR